MIIDTRNTFSLGFYCALSIQLNLFYSHLPIIPPSGLVVGQVTRGH